MKISTKNAATDWFTVDKEGLSKLLERKGKEFVLYELIQNAWDTAASKVDVHLTPVAGKALAAVRVTDDDPNGFQNLTHAWTLFAESVKKGDPEKRGRFNLGEKLVLALCTQATITTTTGSVIFEQDGTRRRGRMKRDRGSEFWATVKMTREEMGDAIKAVQCLIAPMEFETIFNGAALPYRKPRARFEATLPTEISDGEGILRRSARKAWVEVHDPLPGETASIYELGIPVVETGDRWHYNVFQKVPLNIERDNVTPAYLQHVRMLVLNRMHSEINKEEATTAWVRDASADEAAAPEAIETVMTHRFGKKRVISDPTDPEGTKLAMSKGYTVVPGGSLSKGEWSNVKRDSVMLPAGQVTPSPKVIGGSEDGKDDEVPYEKYTDGMEAVVNYATELSKMLIDRTVTVRIVNRFSENHSAWYGDCRLTFNLARLGHKWFNDGPGEHVDNLLIHELGHEFSSDHLSHRFHGALCSLGAHLAVIAMENPAFFKKHGRQVSA